MKLVRYTPPGDDTSRYSATTPYGQPTDGSSSSPSPVIPVYSMSTPTYYDPTTTTSWTSYAPYPTSSTPTVYDFPVTSSLSDPSPPLTSGPAAVSESSATLFTGISTPDVYLSTIASLSPLLTSTAPAKTSNSTSTNRTALIAALTAGLSALVLLLLVAFLLYKRRRRRNQRLDPRVDSRSLPHSALLHDDEMAHSMRMAPSASTALYENSAVGGAIYRPASPSLSILRSRVSESGSIFREEVWPPPSPTIDPIQMRSSQVDLSRIVDDVMGPVDDGDPTRKGHKRELTATSMTPLLLERQTSSGHGSSEEDLTRLYSSPSPLYSPNSPPIIDLPDVRHYAPVSDAFAPAMQLSQSQSSVTSISSSLHSRPPSGSIQSPSSFRPPSRGSLHGSIASSIPQRTQPKVSSPLVRALTGFGVSSHPHGTG